LLRLVRKLSHHGAKLRFCYEDGVIPAARSGSAALDAAARRWTVDRRIRPKDSPYTTSASMLRESAQHPGRQSKIVRETKLPIDSGNILLVGNDDAADAGSGYVLRFLALWGPRVSFAYTKAS
jgi:hypothetical protein